MTDQGRLAGKDGATSAANTVAKAKLSPMAKPFHPTQPARVEGEAIEETEDEDAPQADEAKGGPNGDATDHAKIEEIPPTDLTTRLEAVATAASVPVMLQTMISDYGYRDAVDFAQYPELQGAQANWRKYVADLDN
eukprot:623667-Rhodomonas_salina.1